MRVLIACEESATVRVAFEKEGHEAWSCDVQPSRVAGNHIQADVLSILDDGWDLMIAHPPCTYLSKAGARWLYGGGSIIDFWMKWQEVDFRQAVKELAGVLSKK